MNENAILARLTALEVLSASCFTFLLASAGNDPDLSKAKAILNALNTDADEGLKHLPEGTQAEAKAYLASITSNILQNVQALRGGSQTRQ